MANQGLLNGVWVGTEAGVVTTNQLYVKTIIFKGATAGDAITITDGSNTNDLIVISIGVNSDTKTVTFGGRGKVFPDGLYLKSISSNCKVMIYPESSIL